jgi:hypothetical protein
MKRSVWLQILLAAALLFVHNADSFAQGTTTAPTLKVIVLAQSPAETKTDLQIFCLFRSSPENALHGSLMEINEKLHGLLDKLRTPGSLQWRPGRDHSVSAFCQYHRSEKGSDHRPWRLVELYPGTHVPGRQDCTARGKQTRHSASFLRTDDIGWRRHHLLNGGCRRAGRSRPS